jgi:hypothetical protein
MKKEERRKKWLDANRPSHGRHKLNHGQHAAIVGLPYLKEVLDISRDWEDKETKGQP